MPITAESSRQAPEGRRLVLLGISAPLLLLIALLILAPVYHPQVDVGHLRLEAGINSTLSWPQGIHHERYLGLQIDGLRVGDWCWVVIAWG